MAKQENGGRAGSLIRGAGNRERMVGNFAKSEAGYSRR
jgi:hypothetical protein